LRLCSNPGENFIPELKNAALIRELHVYGEIIPVWDKNSTTKHVQHKGHGQNLINIAENIASVYGYHKMAIISGNGVRNYYINKLGYSLEGTYVTKTLNTSSSETLIPFNNDISWVKAIHKIHDSNALDSYDIIVDNVIECIYSWEPSYSKRKIWFNSYNNAGVVKHNTSTDNSNYILLNFILVLIAFLVTKKLYEYMFL